MSKGKTILSMYRQAEKRKPLYQAMTKLHNWYVEKPHTPGEIAMKIQKLHDRVDQEHQAMEERHAKEFLPILEKMQDAQVEAGALGVKHRQEKEDITLAFAVCEYDLLRERISDVPDHLKPLDARPGKVLDIILRFLEWCKVTFLKPQKATSGVPPHDAHDTAK